MDTRNPQEAGATALGDFNARLAAGLVAALVLTGLLGAAPSAAAPIAQDAPWRRAAPFGLTAGELRAASELPVDLPLLDGAGVVVLFQDTRYTFGDDGRLTQHRHWIYRILEADAIADWSTSQVRWAPWRQERPTIRARVVAPDGSEHWLDPTTARDRQAPETADRRAAERRLTEAPLPAMAVGAVVEEYIELVEHSPEWRGGTSHRHYTALLAPTYDGRLTLDASTRQALRHGSRLMPPGFGPTSTTVEEGRVRVVFDFAALPAVEPPEDGMPGHRPRFPQVAFSTGRSWATVAEAFSRKVDQAIQAAALRAIGEDLRGSSGLKAEPRLAAILEAVRSRAGFNGFEIGAMALDFDVDRTLAEGGGDSLTLAIAAVAALRRAGLEAHVALVRTGFGVDIEPQLPGLGLFNHALVRLGPPGDGGRWLEPSSRYVRPGELTLAMQDRFALIASPHTEDLVRTPASEPEDNLAVEVREIHFADFGPGRLTERCSYHGSAERTQRRITGSLEGDSRRRGYEAYVNAFHLASGLGALRETDPLDLSGPFALELEALDSSRVRTDVESAVLEVPIRELARRLPPVLLDDPRPRREEYVFPEPFISEWRYEIHPPAGFRLTALPPSESLRLGPASFEQAWRVEGDRIVGELRFDVGQRLLAPSQFEALRSALGSFLDRPPSVVRFALEGAGGDAALPAVLADLRRAAEGEGEGASHRIRWALGLLRAGLGVEARVQAQRAVELQPAWGLAHWAFGWTLLHDEAGAPFGGGAQLDAARRALGEAARLMPGEPRIQAALARLAERDDDGARYGDGADLERAAALYAEAAAELGDPTLHRDRLRLLLTAGRFDELGDAIDLAESKLATAAPDHGGRGGLVGDLLGGSEDAFGRRHLAAFRVAASRVDASRVDASGAAVEDDPQLRLRAAAELAAARLYPAAAELARGVDGALAARLERTARFDAEPLHPDDPTTPLRAILTALRIDRPEPEDIGRWLRQGFTAGEIEKLLVDLRRRLPTELGGVPLPPAARADLALADLEIQVNGAPHLGYRLATLGDAPRRDYVTLREEGLRLGGFGSSRATLGVEALERIDDGDLPGAQRWLDWARAEPAPAESAPDAGDPLAFSPFDRLWPEAPPEELAGVEALRVAAAALAAPSGGERSLSLLRQAAEDGTPDPLAVDVALLEAHLAAGDFLGLEAHAGSLLERFPASERAFDKQLEAFAALGRWQALEDAARARLETGTPSLGATRVLAGLAVDRGDPAGAAERLRAAAARGPIDATDTANLLLLMLLEEPPPQAEAEALIERTEGDGELEARWWRAVAAWRAEAGEIAGARYALARSVELAGGRLQLPDAYVVARLAEIAGLPETAEQLYRRLETEPEAATRAPLVRLLALSELR